MDSSTAPRLIKLNRDFYTLFGDAFAATRHRVQPGVRRLLELLQGDEAILDLGCGNGELARELAKRGHRGPYLGVDFSLPLLREAEALPNRFFTRFVQADLTSPSLITLIARGAVSATRQAPRNDKIAQLPWYPTQRGTAPGSSWRGSATPRHDLFDVVFCFATFHHIPSHELRLGILRIVRELVKEDGLFIHSNWQFLNSERLKARVQPWEAAAIPPSSVDPGDYLLDWRNGGKGLRYVHCFDENELESLADSSRFRVIDSFYSDGEGGRLGLYQIWKPV